jgi:hypothetical protein
VKGVAVGMVMSIVQRLTPKRKMERHREEIRRYVIERVGTTQWVMIVSTPT